MLEPKPRSEPIYLTHPRLIAYRAVSSPLAQTDTRPEHAVAIRRTQELGNTAVIQKSRDFLLHLKGLNGELLIIEDLLKGPAKYFGEVLAKNLQAYYDEQFTSQEMQSVFREFVREIFRQIAAKANLLRKVMIATESDPSRGALPVVDEKFSGEAFANMFFRAQKKKKM